MKSVLNFRIGKLCSEVTVFGSLKYRRGDSPWTL